MDYLLLHQGLLLGALIVGRLSAVLTHRLLAARSSQKQHTDSLSRLSTVFAFVAGSLGILLALLLSLAVGDYQTTQRGINEFNSSVSSAFTAVDLFPDAQKTALRSDILCTAQSFSDHELTTSTSPAGTLQTDLWIAQTNSDLHALPTVSGAEWSTYAQVLSDTLQGISHWRSEVLFISTRPLPPVIWFVIYLTVAVMGGLLALSLADRRRFSLLALGATYVALAAMIFGLSSLEFPLNNEGTGGSVATGSVRENAATLLKIYPHQPAPNCPTLLPGATYDWSTVTAG